MIANHHLNQPPTIGKGLNEILQMMYYTPKELQLKP